MHSLLFFLQYFLFLYLITSCHVGQIKTKSKDFVFTVDSILQVIERSCLVAFSSDKASLQSVFDDVLFAFSEDEGVIVGKADFIEMFSARTEKKIKIIKEHDNATISIVIFPRRVEDKSCLQTGIWRPPASKGEVYGGPVTASTVIEFINEKCVSYRLKNSYLSVEGLHRQEILKTLFHVENVSNVSMKDVQRYCSEETCRDVKTFHSHSSVYQQQLHDTAEDIKQNSYSAIHKCEKISLPSRTNFFHDYLKLSKPVIIKDAMKNWPAVRKWSNEYFRKNYGDKEVHIKLTPQGIFEGVDFASEFENFETFHIPAAVQKQLLFPDLVVVRPATQNMNLSEFIDLIESVSEGKTNEISAYLEYSSLADIVSELENDVLEMPFFDHMLKLEHLNIWLSDGNTLGKLHFDPFDNFLCQISGRKEVILFSPHDNTKLYEAHIPEAMLDYDKKNGTFVKKRLVDSTSMVMSPVDLANPDYKRFPKFAEAYPMNCTIEEGEVLFMPAFWWHEVQSYPSPIEKRNLAVNFWYDPFLTKEFPCQECKLDVNPKYRHLL